MEMSSGPKLSWLSPTLGGVQKKASLYDCQRNREEEDGTEKAQSHLLFIKAPVSVIFSS